MIDIFLQLTYYESNEKYFITRSPHCRILISWVGWRGYNIHIGHYMTIHYSFMSIVRCQKMHCSICAILAKPFNRFKYDEKVKIINDGPPRPDIQLSTQYQDKNGKFIRKFNIRQYTNHSWMCSCSEENRLFCWPCLLFSTTKNIWNGDGVRNLNTLSQVQKKT